MVVLPLESLPLGFRFHPTDEELINHYLKGKINGCKPQIEVIPEIDVCKCEPWDLPDKSLIRTNDPEWFFFAPRDRKYPNGHRSNRATEKGYWKATGKDRTIKSRVLSGTMLIGMKKTLVFYRGRAPKGERTCWIMHEYRTVDSEVDGATSDQGAYVLCRLFKKPEERSLSSNCDEIDESGLSPTPTKSSPGDAQHSIDQGMDSVREIIQEIKMQEMREDHQLVVEGVETEPDVIESWLTDGVEHASYPPNLEDSNSNSNIASDIGDHEVELAQLHDNVHLGTPFCLLETDGFPQISSPMPYLDLQLYELDPQLGSFPVDSTEQDSVTEFLDSVLSNYDDNNSGDSNADTLSDQVAHVCGANVVSDNMQSWGFDDGSPSYTNTEGYLLGLEGGYYSQKSSKIGCDEMGNDACKVDAKATTLCYASDFQGLLDSYEGLQTRKISLDTDGDNFVGAGIQIRPTPLRHFSSETSSRQGTARQRIRLQNKLQVGLHVGLPACSEVTESGSPTHDSKIKTTAIEAEVDLQAPKENEPTGSEITSQFGSSDHGETSLTEETLDANEIVGESKPLLRLRKSSNNSHPVPRGPTLKPQYAKGSPLVYLAAGGLSVLFVVLIAGMIKYLII